MGAKEGMRFPAGGRAEYVGGAAFSDMARKSGRGCEAKGRGEKPFAY